jgi:hypothetical protein
MALSTRINTSQRNLACDAIVDSIDTGAGTGNVQIRTGTQPATPGDTATGTLLADFDLPEPAFGASGTGTATGNAITGVVGLAAGDAGYFRVLDGAGAAVMDGSCGVGASFDMNMNTVTISVGVDVNITAWTVTMPGS